MAIEGVSSGAGASASSSLNNSRKSIADNFDTFLSILTTQLKNQNPLEPLDTNQFTQQLVQFTGVEQQLKTNEFLQALVLGNQNTESNKINAANQAVGLIGKTVVAGSSAAQLQDGKASWTYTVGKEAPNAQVNIRDQYGQTVFSQQVSLAKGQGNFEWDGKDQVGADSAPGVYSITIDARDAEGEPVTVLTQTKGVVDMVDLTGDEPVLMVGGSRISLDALLSVTNTLPANSGNA